MNVEQQRRRGAQAGPGSADFVAGLVRLGLSEQGLAPFRAGWVQSHGKRRANIGAVFLHTEAQILQSDEAKVLAAEGLLQIGSCLNGDLVVLDFAREVGAIGFVSHEHLWATPRPPVRDHLAPVARSLDHLEQLARDEDGFPMDYFEAVELNEGGAIVRVNEGGDYRAAMLELTGDWPEHSLLRRLSWNPFLVGPLLALTTNQLIHVWPSPLHILGELVIVLWFGMSLVDFMTDHSLLDELYAEEDGVD